ncbi:MAG: hypothetical protein WCS34_00390 [Bacteroidales bacterium]
MFRLFNIKQIVISLLIILSVSSCKFTDKIFDSDIIARIGKQKLYKSEVESLLPKNISSEDSIRLTQEYINSWATKHLLLDVADKHLPKNQKNVTKQLEEYKSSLLVYRYEELYVKQRLDTLVTTAECESYYNAHKDNFISDVSIIKARYIKILSSSPNVKVVKSLYKAKTNEDLQNLEEVCHDSADKYSIFDGKWISLEQIAKELDMTIGECEKEIRNKNYIEKEDEGYDYLVYIFDRIAPKQISPFDYNIEKIKEIIISRRKHQLILDLERNLLNNAIDNNNLLIYSK